MALTENSGVQEHLVVQMEDCAPPPAPAADAPAIVPSVEPTPVEQAQHATIEQTGAGPPPE